MLQALCLLRALIRKVSAYLEEFLRISAKDLPGFLVCGSLICLQEIRVLKLHKKLMLTKYLELIFCMDRF